MKPLRFLLAFAAVASLASVACSSSGGDDDDPSAGAGGAGASSTGFSSAAFSAYCSGTLLTEREVLRANGGGAWLGSGEKVPAGTRFLVEEGFDKWATGYLLLADGTVAKLDADFSKGLVKDVDFSTSCAAPVSFERHRLVMLKTTTLFPDKDLTGTPCTLEAGTGLKSWGYSGGAGTSELSSPDVKATCSFDKGYSKDIVFGKLVTQ